MKAAPRATRRLSDADIRIDVPSGVSSEAADVRCDSALRGGFYRTQRHLYVPANLDREIWLE